MNKQSEYTKKWLEKSKENADSKKISDAKSRAKWFINNCTLEQLKEHKELVDKRFSELKKLKTKKKNEDKDGK